VRIAVPLRTVKATVRKGVMTIMSETNEQLYVNNEDDPVTDTRFPRIMEYHEELDFPEQAFPCMTRTMEDVNLGGS